MIGFLVPGRVRIKIRIRVRVRVIIGATVAGANVVHVLKNNNVQSDLEYLASPGQSIIRISDMVGYGSYDTHSKFSRVYTTVMFITYSLILYL